VESAKSFLGGCAGDYLQDRTERVRQALRQVLGDNGQAIIQQLETTDVSLYHHRVIIKPETLLPEFDYEGGEQ
jgi:hypothetical protein